MSTEKSKQYAVFIRNRKASFEYQFLDKVEAGLVLLGTEVKGIREGLVSFNDCFGYFNNGELYIKGLNIANPKQTMSYRHDENRERKVLMTKKELRKWEDRLKEGLTIIPYYIRTNSKGIIKIELALAKGKKTYDKKNSIKERDIAKETKRELLNGQ